MSVPVTVRETRDAVRRGALSARDAVRACLDRIGRVDPALKSFLQIAGDQALDRAAALDASRRSDDDRPLLGVPIAIKDNISTRGIRTTAGSKMLEQYVPPYDATVIARLEAAGAIVVGKTNCDEFAMGSSTENSAFAITRNPWDAERTPGGSSGGSAAAVAARLVPVALGSDTGGSVRQPAAMCGIVGLKPTYGRVSRYGLVAFGSSLDQIGPLALTVDDSHLILAAIAGRDPADSTSAGAPSPDPIPSSRRLDGVRIGVPSSLVAEGVDRQVAGAFAAALDVCRTLGASIVEVALPHARFAIPVYYLIATAEASANLARYDGVGYGFRAPLDRNADLTAMYERTRDAGFGAEVKRRIMVGTYALSAGYYDAYYLKAQQVRTLIRRDYEQAFASVDVVALPTSPVPPFRLGERLADPLQMYLADVFTVSANLAGLPAISVPGGFTAERLPIGFQLTGRAFAESELLRIAAAYEEATGWWRHNPPINAVAAA